MEKTQAYLEGYNAFFDGTSNPFHPKDNEWNEWEAGYNEAEKQDAEK